MQKSFLRTVVTICFFLSGAAGLVYEVVWARQLGLFLGITSFAHTAVITAYMAGLAAGSVYFGRRADRHANPLLIYVYLEIGVGLFAATTPWLFGWLQAGYADLSGVTGVSGMSAHLSRFAIALAALLIPTFLMGGTLPLLVRGFVESLPDLGRATGRLYGINTLGAMTGTLAAGYWLLPAYGIPIAIFTGVIINLAIAVVVFLLLKVTAPAPQAEASMPAEPQQSVQQPDTAPHSRPRGTAFILLGFGLAGFASLLTQMAWIRSLILVVGGSVYAFTITLASFLAGIGLGSLAYGRYSRSRLLAQTRQANGRRAALAAFLALLIGMSLLLSLALIGKLPGWFLSGYASGLHANFTVFQLFIFLLSFSVMILPTFLMGLMFPLVAVIWTRAATEAGRGVGTAYAVNTVGTIFGALLGGLLFLPWLGIHKSILLTASLYLVTAGFFWVPGSLVARPVNRALVALLAVLVFSLAALQVPAWDRDLMGRGVFYSPDRALKARKAKAAGEDIPSSEILYYREGLDGTVVVREDAHQRYLVINGKTDATSKGDMPTQVLLGHLPVLMQPRASRALIIGLGSGATAGAVATHEGIEDLTVLEISSEVIEASTFFEDVNAGVLSDPRVSLVEADARNFLMASESRYDLIISEPSNPWLSGVSNLFTQEFFELARRRLAPGGMVTQWIHMYSMSDDDLRVLLHTFASVFPQVSAWHPLGGDILLIGSIEPQSLDANHLSLAFENPAVSASLKQIEMTQSRDLLRTFLFQGSVLETYAAGQPLNTDTHPLIEFNSPRYLYADTSSSNLRSIVTHLGTDKQKIPVLNLVESTQEGLRIPVMSLEINTVEGSEWQDIDANWLVYRQLTAMEGGEGLGVGSERWLQWREADREYRVQATLQYQIPELEQRLIFIRSLITQERRQGGDITMLSGHEGQWMLGQSQGNSLIELAIVWTCPNSEGRHTRYAVHSVLPDPGKDHWGDALVRLGNRFRCTQPALLGDQKPKL